MAQYLLRTSWCLQGQYTKNKKLSNLEFYASMLSITLDCLTYTKLVQLFDMTPVRQVQHTIVIKKVTVYFPSGKSGKQCFVIIH